jgi:uncharacterized NAD-dependent epimerase/dehydratase family protein
VRLTPNCRIAVLLHGGVKDNQGKTGLAYLRYGAAKVVAAIDEETAGESLRELTGIPQEVPIVNNVRNALAYNPNVLLIGIAPSGGVLPPAWWQDVETGVKAGLSIVNGLHTPMTPVFSNLNPDQWIWDLRREPEGLGIAQAKARSLSCQRILTVGTDMSVGKMSASLELDRAAKKRGLRSQFLGTGQGGVMIAGDGICLDAVRVDFAAGAVEKLVLDRSESQDILWIEGQGSLCHPGSTATLPLLRGSQPTGLILAHRYGQTHIRNVPEIAIPPLPTAIALYEAVAQMGGSFGTPKVLAIALNTHHLEESEAKAAIDTIVRETGLPCDDVVRHGGDRLLLNLMEAGLGR